MEIRSLSGVSLDAITTCFNEAFTGYFVKIQATADYLQHRWYGARVDYNRSWGAFDGDQLVGFVIFAIDERDGMLTAHNAATGVLPAYRNQSLIQRIYAAALPGFRQNGIHLFTLEVITENIRAIKLYQSLGYHIDRLLYCYQGPITLPGTIAHSFHIRQHKDVLTLLNAPLNSYYFSWENDRKTLLRMAGDYECWQLEDGDQLKAFVIMNPANGYMIQYGFETGHTDKYGTALLQEICRHYLSVRITNLDSQYSDVKALFDKCGLTRHINQFEMTMSL